MLGENLMEGVWFWKAPIKTTLDIRGTLCVSESSTVEGCLEELTPLTKTEITFFTSEGQRF